MINKANQNDGEQMRGERDPRKPLGVCVVGPPPYHLYVDASPGQ